MNWRLCKTSRGIVQLMCNPSFIYFQKNKPSSFYFVYPQHLTCIIHKNI